MLTHYFRKPISFLILMLFCIHTASFPISNAYSKENKSDDATLALSSIFYDKKKAVSVITNEAVVALIDLYHQGQIDHAVINSLLSYFEGISRQTNRHDWFFEMQAALIFKMYYKHLGTIRNVASLLGGVMPKKPVKIETNEGKKYVVKFMGDGTNTSWKDDKKSIKVRIQITNYLHSKGIPIHKIFSKTDTADDFIVEIRGAIFIVTEFLAEGKILKPEELTMTHHAELGKTIAKIQNLCRKNKKFEKIKTGTDVYFEQWMSFVAEKISELKKDKTKAINSSLYDLYFTMIIDQYKLFNERYKAKKFHSFAFVHTDLHPLNVLYDREGKVRGIVDIERFEKLFKIREFLSPLQARVLPKGGKPQLDITYSLKNFKAMLIAYQIETEEPLTTLELRDIIEILRLHFIRDSIGYLLAIEECINLKKHPENSKKIQSFFKKFKNFIGEFSDEKKIRDFVREIQDIKKLEMALEHQKSYWTRSWKIWSWWNLTVVVPVIKFVTYNIGSKISMRITILQKYKETGKLQRFVRLFTRFRLDIKKIVGVIAEVDDFEHMNIKQISALLTSA